MNRTSPFSSTVGALAGAGFAVLLFLCVFIVDPLREATDQDLLTWWSDSGKLRDNIISMYMLVAAGPLFLVFLAQLCQRLRSAGESAESWSRLVFGAGVTFAALLAVTAFSRGVVAQSIRFSDEPVPGPDTLRYATALSQAAFSIGAVPFVTLAVATASAIIVRTGVLARWFGWLGLVVSALSLLLVVLLMGAFSIPLFALWTVAASFLLWRTRNEVAGDTVAQRAAGSGVGSASAIR